MKLMEENGSHCTLQVDRDQVRSDMLSVGGLLCLNMDNFTFFRNSLKTDYVFQVMLFSKRDSVDFTHFASR